MSFAKNDPAPNFSLPATDGNTYAYADIKGEHATVIMFWCNHCPYVIPNQDRVIAMQDEYGRHGVRFAAICANNAQTHPADGNCGFIVTTRDKAKALSKDPGIEIQIVSYGYARVAPGYMAAAPVPAAEMALREAGLKVEDMKAIKTHNPFVVNDINMAKKMGMDVMGMNNYGSSLIYGHPQAPTAGRLIAELLEEVVMLGGGYGLWAGCAAGDTAAAMIFKIT